MNIKNAETERLTRELAALTGKSMTAAVTDAVREKLERIRSRKGISEQLLAIGRDIAERLEEPYKSMDHGDILYDENGLPK